MKHNRFGYLIGEGLKSIFTHGFMSFACILVIVACLLIMGSFAMLALNIDYNIDQLEQDSEILAFVDEDLTTEEAESIGIRLEAIENIKSVEFVTREQALENWVSQYSEEEQDMFSDLTPSVFRNRYRIYLEDISRMGETKREIESVSGIAECSASLELSQGFITVRNIVSVISMILIVILFIVSIFIMQNTIKLATFSRREEIGIMKMVGASNFFIRCPFVVEGLVLGLVGGAIAFLLQWGIYDLVAGKIMTSSLASLLIMLPFSTLMYPLLIVFLAIGLVVGTFGSNIAIRNYLKA